jgi:predicted transcriptional regulator of viral defense system
MEQLKKLGIIPVNKSVLYSLFHDLKQPKDKISDLERKGLIVRIKRDLYVVSKQVHNREISRELVANHLYGPSYISLESALAHYGLIPERVYAMRSACMKMHKRYNTPLGQFEYEKVPVQYFQIGVHQEIIDSSYCFLIASPEKALCDLILCTGNLRLQSAKAMSEYLEEDLRFEMSALTSFNFNIVEECYAFGRKKTELAQLLKLLSNEKQYF